jgi:hypothetical protein
MNIDYTLFTTQRPLEVGYHKTKGIRISDDMSKCIEVYGSVTVLFC